MFTHLTVGLALNGESGERAKTGGRIVRRITNFIWTCLFAPLLTASMSAPAMAEGFANLVGAHEVPAPTSINCRLSTRVTDTILPDTEGVAFDPRVA